MQYVTCSMSYDFLTCVMWLVLSTQWIKEKAFIQLPLDSLVNDDLMSINSPIFPVFLGKKCA